MIVKTARAKASRATRRQEEGCMLDSEIELTDDGGHSRSEDACFSEGSGHEGALKAKVAVLFCSVGLASVPDNATSRLLLLLRS